MPYKYFVEDEKSIPQAFKEYIEYIYDGNCMIESADENEAYFSMNVPGELKREDFENDVQDFCEEHNCSFELINQTPEAPSPQFFSENLKLMYPKVKNFEALKKQDRKFQIAKELWKRNWGNVEFNEEDPDDQEDIVLLYNEYMEDLSEWKPVELKLHYNQNLKQDSEKQESYKGYARKPYTNLSSEEEQIRHELEWDLGAKEDEMGITLSHAYDDLLRDYKYVRGNENAMNRLMKAFKISKEDLLRYIAYKEDGLLMPKDGHKTRDSEIKDSQTWAIMYEYTDDEKTFKEHLGERNIDYVRGNSKDEAIENFKKQIKEGLVYPKGKYLRIMNVGKLSGKENLNQVEWIKHSEIVK